MEGCLERRTFEGLAAALYEEVVQGRDLCEAVATLLFSAQREM